MTHEVNTEYLFGENIDEYFTKLAHEIVNAGIENIKCWLLAAQQWRSSSMTVGLP